MLNPWFSLFFKTVQLGFEAQNVIALRMMRLAAGGATAQREASRMITDKIAAGVECRRWRLRASRRVTRMRSSRAKSCGY